MTQMRFVGYAYADRRREYDVAHQVETLRDFAARLNVKLGRIYLDLQEEHSGIPPGLVEMIEAAERGEFEALLVVDSWAVMRVGPRVMELQERWQRAGVTVLVTSLLEKLLCRR